jgi:glycosyltransferase involved in cell wall biosynthesis
MATDGVRIAIVADGSLTSPATNSGVALGLATALCADDRVVDVIAVNSLLGPVGKALARLASFHPRRSEWDRKYFQGLARQWLRSMKRDWIIRRAGRRPDVIIHIRNVYYPAKTPYFAFVDTTYGIRQKEWPKGGFDEDFLKRRLQLESDYFGSATGVLTAGAYVAQQINDRVPAVAAAVPVGAGLNIRVLEQAKPETTRRVVFVGKEFDRKGGTLLLEAFSRVRDEVSGVELHIVGTPIHIEEDGVVCHGLVTDRNKLSAIYASGGVFCLPAHFEPFGLVVLEAMAHGLPCIVSEVGVLPDLVADGESGIVVPRGDVDSLVAALVRLLSDESLRQAMGSSARDRSREFTWEAVAARTLDAIGASAGNRIRSANRASAAYGSIRSGEQDG